VDTLIEQPGRTYPIERPRDPEGRAVAPGRYGDSHLFYQGVNRDGMRDRSRYSLERNGIPIETVSTPARRGVEPKISFPNAGESFSRGIWWGSCRVPRPAAWGRAAMARRGIPEPDGGARATGPVPRPHPAARWC